MHVAEQELLWHVKQLTQSDLVAFEIVNNVFKTRNELHPSGKILILDGFVPWKSALAEVEKQCNLQGHI